MSKIEIDRIKKIKLEHIDYGKYGDRYEAFDDIQTLLSHIESQEKELAEAVETLKFYANKENYKASNQIVSGGIDYLIINEAPEFLDDKSNKCYGGNLARTLLAKLGKED